MMMLFKTVLLLSWAANECNAFVPSVLVPRRDLLQTRLSKNNHPTTKSEAKVKHCIPLQEIGLDDLPKVGGKTASLGEMIQNLTPLGVSVPGGFGVSSSAYDAVLDRFELRERLELLLKDVDVNDLEDLADRGRQARLMIMNAGLPDQVTRQIEEGYEGMCKEANCGCSVAVRSSATAEDLPTASFAGQQASFLNVSGKRNVCNAVLECLFFFFFFFLR